MSDYGDPYVYQSSRSRVRAPSELREFPPYEDYIGKHPMVRDHLKLFAQAPWFDPIGITDRDLLNQYLVAGEYPGRVPAFAVGTFDWAHRCAVPLQAILKRGAAERHEPERAKEAHVRLVYQRLNRTVGTDIIPMPMPGEHDLDTWYYRTEGEAGYGEKLMQLDYARYRGVIDVKQDVLCFDRPILRAEFRYLRKNNQESFWDLIRWERRARCRLGILVPYQMVEAERIHRSHYASRYVVATKVWESLEVPRGCLAELPPSITYLGSRLIADPRSGVWVVVITEWVARVAAFILWDAYDIFRLWYIPPAIRGYAKKLDLSFVLGSRENANEFSRMIAKVEEINWEQVPANQNKRGTRRDRHCLGRTGPSGDYVWYDPFKDEVISEEEAARMRRLPREIPEGHPRGYIFEPAPVTGLAQLGVRDDEPMPQATPQVPASPLQRSESTNSDEITRMPRSVKRRTEEHSPRHTPTAGNGDEITPNAGTNNVDATKKDSGNDRMMSALQRFAADIDIGGSSHNLIRDELMDLVYAKFDKVDAEQSRKAAREAMEIEKQVPGKKNSAGNSAENDVTASKPITGKRDAPGSASQPIEEARRVPLPGSPKALGNPEKKTIAGPSAMPMARVRSLRDMLSLPADTGRPVKKADPPARKLEASKETSKKPSSKMDTSKN